MERQDLARSEDAVVKTELPNNRVTSVCTVLWRAFSWVKSSHEALRFREVMVLAVVSSGGIRTSLQHAADSQQVFRTGWPLAGDLGRDGGWARKSSTLVQ